jgi:predicted ester cyclase
LSNIQQIRLTIRKKENPYFDFYDGSLIIHGFSPNLQANKEGFKQFIYLLRKAFPDTRIIFVDIVIEGNKVALRCNLSGTRKGEFMDLGQLINNWVNGMTVFLFE